MGRPIHTNLEVSPSLKELLAAAKNKPKTARGKVTVDELIRELQKFNPGLTVYIRDKGEWLNNPRPGVQLESHTDGETRVTTEYVVIDF